MPLYTDQCNRVIQLDQTPQKIVSLVPSLTELLSDLGLEKQVVGITKFCVHPNSWFRNKTRVGGTKNLSFDKIQSLKPDLIIASKEENKKEEIEALEKTTPVWISNIANLEDALSMIKTVGNLTGTILKADKIIADITFNFSCLTPAKEDITAAYLIWKDPYITVGGDTFISSMMKLCGWKNVYENTQRYPEISIQQLKERNTRLILLSSEPYPFQLKHLEEIKKQIPQATVKLVDGEMFSWYGSRLIQTATYLRQILEQDICNS